MNEITFEPFPKLARLNRLITITEKIDGTNAQVIITEDGKIGAASRSRLITPEDDNYGFAKFVQDNKEELLKLGPGRHFGEWWGRGIQKRYSSMQEKRFSLFNTHRWTEENTPECCYVVPILYQGVYDNYWIESTIENLCSDGSLASPGDPAEGIVIWHDAARTYFKVTVENDEMSKGEVIAKREGLHN